MNLLPSILVLGLGATATIDLWAIIRKPLLGIVPPNYALVGRWIAHMRSGRFRHDAITKSAPVPGEHLLGWVVHYLTGIAFATLLIGCAGTAWLEQPTPGPALALGIGTVLAPFLLMQPGMGAGIAASKTPRPSAARLQSVITHAMFGLGLYVTGLLLKFL